LSIILEGISQLRYLFSKVFDEKLFAQPNLDGPDGVIAELSPIRGYIRGLRRRQYICLHVHIIWGALGSVVGSGTILQAGSSRFRYPMMPLNIFNVPNPSSRTRPWSLLSL
jgi:hypothetical protein